MSENSDRSGGFGDSVLCRRTSVRNLSRCSWSVVAGGVAGPTFFTGILRGEIWSLTCGETVLVLV